MLSPLRCDVLRAALLPPYAALDVVEVTGSTNADLAAAARAGAADRTVLLAEWQTAGRGRLGRSWEAPAHTGLALSVLLRPVGVPPARWGWLPLLTGLALCEVVGELGRVDAVLKWPNDLLVGPRQGKAAGILAEVVGGAVVVGVGLNVGLRAEDLPVPAATSLAVEGAACTDREELATALLLRLDDLVRRWCAHGGDAVACGLRDAYRNRCSTLGQPVAVQVPDGAPVTGAAVDVDPEGRLILDTAQGRRAMSAGDVGHVRPG